MECEPLVKLRNNGQMRLEVKKKAIVSYVYSLDGNKYHIIIRLNEEIKGSIAYNEIQILVLPGHPALGYPRADIERALIWAIPLRISAFIGGC